MNRNYHASVPTLTVAIMILVGVARPTKTIFGSADVDLASIATEHYRYER